MNGDGSHPSVPAPPGPPNTQATNGDSQYNVSRIIEALEAVHGARSSNETRKQASLFLEEAKADAEAPYHGFTLASDPSQSPVVRHFALSLLEHAIRYRWVDYSEGQALALRQWVTVLAQNIGASDPPYLRSKIAQLWVEVAKRSWANQWMNMDEELLQLWSGAERTETHKIFVAEVLEGLSEDIFNREDATATLRGSKLSKACVDIFTPAVVLHEQFPNRSNTIKVRSGEEGWLVRLADYLFHWTESTGHQDQTGPIKVIAALKAALGWSIPKAIVASRCVPSICRCLALSNVPMQMASTEALHSLYCRSQYQDDEFIALVCPLYETDSVNLLRKIFEWSVTDASDIDQEKYQLAKKFSEMMSNLGNFIEERPLLIPDGSDLPGFLNLMLLILSSPSLTVSIPVLNTWVRLLKSDVIGGSDMLSPLIGPLLETCSQRLLRYESLPDDSEDPSFLFLIEDIDTIPERHAFLGNYRRYCVDVVEVIVRRKPFEAVYHILGQVDQSLQTLYQQQPQFSAEVYSKSSIPLLRVDAHFTVVEAALRGYMRWIHSHGSTPQQDELERSTMETNLENWCERLMDMGFEDPLIQRRILQVGVAFSTSALDKKADFMLKVLKHILMTRPVENPAYPTYSEAVRELQNDCTHELHRLAIKMPDYLLTVYADLEAKINEIVSTDTLDDRQRVSFYSFLFIINHRSTTIDPQLQQQRLRAYISPITLAWQSPQLTHSLESFEGFCDLAGVGRVQQYLASRRVHEVQDWSSHPLDDEGKAIQDEINEKFKQLPLRPTKGFLGVSVNKVRKDSRIYQIATELWHDALPIMLPNILKLLSYSHAYYEPSKWPGLPPEMRSIVSRTLTDRFWQAGISTGSKDAFLAKLSGTKATLEGFASSVRGAIRSIREFCYSLLYCMSRLDVHFYAFEGLPGPLADALFSDVQSMSSHQLSTMLNMVRCLVDDCPVTLRESFLSPVLSKLFTEINTKITAEWTQLTAKAQARSDDENLTTEMKEESILRQLTNTAVMMVAGLLDPQRENPPGSSTTHHPPPMPSPPTEASGLTTRPHTLRSFLLSHPPILHPLVLFLTSAITYRDTRSAAIAIRVLRSIVPDFPSTSDELQISVREHISSAVLTAAITSLNDPYFVDVQKDLAQLIAAIYINYAPLTGTPRAVLLSLDGLTEAKIDRMQERMFGGAQAGKGDTKATVSERTQRGLVLDLLEGVRGVSVSEMGKVKIGVRGGGGTRKKERSDMMEKFVTGGGTDGKGRRGARDGSIDLDGVGEMFGT